MSEQFRGPDEAAGLGLTVALPDSLSAPASPMAQARKTPRRQILRSSPTESVVDFNSLAGRPPVFTTGVGGRLLSTLFGFELLLQLADTSLRRRQARIGLPVSGDLIE